MVFTVDLEARKAGLRAQLAAFTKVSHQPTPIIHAAPASQQPHSHVPSCSTVLQIQNLGGMQPISKCCMQPVSDTSIAFSASEADDLLNLHPSQYMPINHPGVQNQFLVVSDEKIDRSKSPCVLHQKHMLRWFGPEQFELRVFIHSHGELADSHVCIRTCWSTCMSMSTTWALQLVTGFWLTTSPSAVNQNVFLVDNSVQKFFELAQQVVIGTCLLLMCTANPCWQQVLITCHHTGQHASRLVACAHVNSAAQCLCAGRRGVAGSAGTAGHLAGGC